MAEKPRLSESTQHSPLTPVSGCAELPGVAALAVDVSVLAVAEDHRVEGLLAGGAVRALLVVHTRRLPAAQHALRVEHLPGAPVIN